MVDRVDRSRSTPKAIVNCFFNRLPVGGGGVANFVDNFISRDAQLSQQDS